MGGLTNWNTLSNPEKNEAVAAAGRIVGGLAVNVFDVIAVRKLTKAVLSLTTEGPTAQNVRATVTWGGAVVAQVIRRGIRSADALRKTQNEAENARLALRFKNVAA